MRELYADGRSPVRRVLRPLHEGDRLTGVDERYRNDGWGYERYAYDGERIARIDYARESEERAFNGSLWLRFDESGGLLTIVGRSGRVLYRRTSPAAVRQAQRLLEQRLPERIAAWIARFAPEDAVYCLGIVHGYDEPYNPMPMLGLGTERERLHWTQTLTGADLRTTMWNPAEFERFDATPSELSADAELAKACQTLQQEWRATEDDEAVPQLLSRCAAQRRDADAVRRLDAPAGLVVLVVDDELSTLGMGLRMSARKGQLTRLEQPKPLT